MQHLRLSKINLSPFAGALLLALCAGAALAAEPAIVEVEPNNTPAEATPITVPAILMGSMEGRDQDAYRWTVSDVDAQQRWTFELHGVPGRLTIVEILRVTFAENGVDVTGFDKLMTVGTRDGLKPSLVEDLIFEPGDYILGFAHAGGGGGGFRPPAASISFGEAADADSVAAEEPGGYRLSIRQGKPIPTLQRDFAARGTRADAVALRLGAETAGFGTATTSWHALEFNETTAAQRWDVGIQVPVGRDLQATLRDAEGGELARASTDARGRLAFPGLAPAAGKWFLELRGAADSGFVRAIAIESGGVRVEGEEAEPNNTWALANRVDLRGPVSGRLSPRNEADYFRFTLDETATEQSLRLGLETAEPEHQVDLCLLDGKGQRLQCRARAGTIELAGLVLTPGDWGFVVERGPADAAYTVTLAGDGPVEPDFEAEPNDSVATASSTPATNRIRGRFDGKDDVDVYRLVVTEEAQLWRVQVNGDNLFEVSYHNASGARVQVVRTQPGQKRVWLENLYLLPGVHYVSVSGRGAGEYTLLARPIGPPDPNGELEPNDDTSRMQPLRIGQTRTGLLEDVADIDYYRFSLDHWDHIRLTITPPADGSILPQLSWYGQGFKERRGAGVGEPIELSGLFPPGDYAVALKANGKQTSEAEYRIALERLPRFGCAADCEPNDNVSFANPVPPTPTIEGRAGEWNELDIYALPVFDADTEVRLTASRAPRNVAEYAGRNNLLPRGPDGVYRGIMPAGTRAHIFMGPDARAPDYRLELEFAGGPAPADAAGDPPLALALQLEATEVAAYRHYGQRVRGSLEITNTGAAAAAVLLDAATSNYRWRVALEQARATIPAGGALRVPVLLSVPDDAWADRPVRVSVRTRAAAGGQVETYAEIAAGRETPPVEPVRHWALPEALLGGFNAALEPLGGRMVEQYNDGPGSGFQLLFDGMAADQENLRLRGGVPNPPVTVELAGGRPVEVTGVAVNLMGGRNPLNWLRDVDVSLSMDGETFTPVLLERLLPIQSEQAFVLETPIEARFARLTLRDDFGGLPDGGLTLGEFKVIARPGTDLSGGAGFNLADPALGGHVVWISPDSLYRYDTGARMLTADDGSPLNSTRRFPVPPGDRLEWVVGFHHARAAQLTRVEWTDQPRESAHRITGVTVSASLDSPVGPWLPVGEWSIDATGEPQVFELEQPVWARYLKFTSAPATQRGLETPATLRIWERPTGGEYRSILTEWGDVSQAAIFEALQEIEIEPPLARTGNDSRATAAALELGQLVGGQVQLGAHEHWYRLRVPEGQNVLTLQVGGDPTVRTVIALENEAGEPVPVRKLDRGSTPLSHVYEGLVESGGVYYVRVEEPPRNVAFLWDTSPSVHPYIDMIYNAMAAYAADLVPGRDAANFVPFGDAPLLRDWHGHPYLLQTVLNDYPRSANSSAAEGSLAIAMRALAPRPGTKAVVIVTDAHTPMDMTVWDEFRRVQARVFALHVSSAGNLVPNYAWELDLMQEWARVNGGHYAYANGHGEMEVAFDRAATMLRRPADYSLRVEAEYREAPGPGLLSVVRRAAGDAGTTADGAVALILDASGSMLQRLDGKHRIAIARNVLTEAVNKYIAPGTPVAMRVFGHREANACRSDLEIPLGPLDPAAASRVIAGINAMNLARTPIADSLALIESDLKGASGRKVVVLVTDGEETCGGDPAAVIERLQERGLEISLNIVGFAIDDVELERQFERWAELGGGRYFSATNQAGLSEAVAEALQVPFTVYDMSGGIAATGVVGGEPVELPAAFYRVVVSGSPSRTFDRVEIAGESTVSLDISQ